MERSSKYKLQWQLVTAFIGTMLLIPHGVFATPEGGRDSSNAARSHYNMGKTLYEQGNFAESLAEFQAAYDAKPHPIVLKSIAECQVMVGSIPDAIRTLEQFLETSKVADKKTVQKRIKDLRQMIVSLNILSIPEKASIIIDGNEIEQVTPTTIPLNLGEHEIVFNLKDYKPFSKKVKLKTAGTSETILVDFVLEGTPLVAPEPLAPEPLAPEESESDTDEEPEPLLPVKEDKNSGGPHSSFWACAAIAGVGLISGTVFGTMALTDEDDYNKTPTEAKKDAGERNGIIADVSFGVAIAAAVTGTIILLMLDKKGKRKSKKKSAKLDIRPVKGDDVVGINTTVRF
jgi:hypothetical protein